MSVSVAAFTMVLGLMTAVGDGDVDGGGDDGVGCWRLKGGGDTYHSGGRGEMNSRDGGGHKRQGKQRVLLACLCKHRTSEGWGGKPGTRFVCGRRRTKPIELLNTDEMYENVPYE